MCCRASRTCMLQHACNGLSRAFKRWLKADLRVISSHWRCKSTRMATAPSMVCASMWNEVTTVSRPLSLHVRCSKHPLLLRAGGRHGAQLRAVSRDAALALQPAGTLSLLRSSLSCSRSNPAHGAGGRPIIFATGCDCDSATLPVPLPSSAMTMVVGNNSRHQPPCCLTQVRTPLPASNVNRRVWGFRTWCPRCTAERLLRDLQHPENPNPYIRRGSIALQILCLM